MAVEWTNHHKDAILNVVRGINYTAFTPYLGLLLWEAANQKAVVSVNVTSNQLEITAHGYSADQILILDSINGAVPGVLPAPLARKTPYYVIGVDANNIQLAATPGGSAIDLTDTGTGTHYVHPGITAAGTGMSEAAAGVNGYNRQPTAFAAPATVGQTRQIATSETEQWVASGGPIGKAAAVGLWDAATAGNLKAFDYATPEQINDGGTYQVGTGNFKKSLG